MRTFLALLICLLCTAWLVGQTQPAQSDSDIHKPLIDLDDDLFSPVTNSYRGAEWRGRDSNDLDPQTYPGCHDEANGLIDNNCNGIYGWPEQGKYNYETLFCEKSEARGVVIFGDSAAAAFHIPKEWIIERGLTPRYKELFLPTTVNEFDWPHKSWATGYLPELNGVSIYLKMRERNHANHRDYQNLGVNGAKAKDLKDQVKDFARRPTDKPVLAFVAYIGNDICKKTLDGMTQSAEFKQSILEGLAALDQKIPAGSHVMMIGLVDGRFLWNTVHNLRHPLGITYAEFYEFLAGIDSNPCRTWLTPDATSREQASARARELSAILAEIARTQKYEHFELAYMDFPLQKVFNIWTGQGGHPADLIEAVDGFHPSHIAHRVLCKVIWDELATNHPSFIGPVNPHNAEITKTFGDQGGH